MSLIARRTLLQIAATTLGGLALIPSPADGATLSGQGSRLTFELYRDTRRQFRWRLKAANGRIIAVSGENYTTKANCRAAIDRIIESAATARVEDLS